MSLLTGTENRQEDLAPVAVTALQCSSALVLPPMQSCDLMPVSGVDRLETNHLLVFQYSPFGASHTLWSSAVFLHSL